MPASVPASGKPAGKAAGKPAAAPRHEDSGAWESLSDGDLVPLGEGEFGGGDDIASIPAPERPSPLAVADLPAPVGPLPTRSTPDPLAPVGPAPSESRDITDLPAPVGPTPSRRTTDAPADEPDLLAPVGPTPSKATGLPAPVGPVPTRGVDLPAPKGFFDDGVQPRSVAPLPDLVAPVGPVPTRGVDLPAPKGFFDDGVQPSRPSDGHAGPPPTTAPHPLDLGDPIDLGEPISAAEPIDLGDPFELGSNSIELGEPVALGDPLGSGPAPSRPFGLDADALEFGSAGAAAPAPAVPIELDGPQPESGAREIDLGAPGAVPLELEASDAPPVASPSSVVTFTRAAAPAGSGAPASRPAQPGRPADPFAPSKGGVKETSDLALDLDTSGPPGAAPAAAPAAKKPAPRAAVATTTRKPAGRRRTLVLGAALGVVALGAGGYVGWGHLQGEKTRHVRSARGLKAAERLLADDAPGHWQKAAAEAERVYRDDPGATEALALVAEANFAAALDENNDIAARTARGDRALDELRKASGRGPHATKAEALRAILSTSFESAVKKLRPLGDADARLYLGWALAAREEHAAAAEAFSAALEANPNRIPALYGLGLSKLALGADEEARKALQAVIDQSRDRHKRDHLGALIGLAQLAPVSEREARYQELLARPDLAEAPPKAVSRLRALAGDEALRSGRLDQARALYDEARRLDPLNLRAVVGLAVLAARRGDLAGARKRLTGEVLAVAPDHVEAALALAEVQLAEGDIAGALAAADALLARKPPIQKPSLVARAHLVRGRAYEASADPSVQARAEAEYREAMGRADPGDFTAAVRLAVLLGKLGRSGEAAKVLEPANEAAQKDPDLALTLGGAYLAAGHADRAVAAFRSAVKRRPDDLGARYQLAQALLAQGKVEEAIRTLRDAFEADPAREDVGLALARVLEERGKLKEAVAVFEKMLAGTPSISVRARAGRFFALHGMHAQAVAQGQAIRAASPRHPAGLFLQGEELWAAGKLEEAQRAYREAARLDPQAQYLEGLGRAAERLGQLDEALRQYAHAIELDPAYLAPRLGRARVRLVRREYALAISELEAARTLAPDNAAVLRGLGEAHLIMRDVSEAVPLLERATRLDPDDAEAHYHLGSAYYDLERAREAAAQLSRAARGAPENAPWRADAYRLLGYASRAAGNRSTAMAAWRTYLELDPKDSAQRRDVQRLLLRLEAR